MSSATWSNDIYQQIKDRLDIVELVGEYVSLQRRSSNNYFGLCPFHNEKTASFSVSATKQIYHCFGCHKGGDIVSFIKEIEHLESKEALQFLAKRANIAYQPGYSSAKQRAELSATERQYLLANKAAAFYYKQLRTSMKGQAGAYLRVRNLQAEAANAFALGAAPATWHALVDELTRLGFSREEMLASTLIREKNGRLYDMFRNRLIFPILDRYDRVVAFGARAFDDSKPKYINSPENSIYIKGRHLYAYNLVKKQKAKEVLVVEGYMDVVSLHQKNYRNAVAVLGTALTPEQAHLLKLLNRTVILCLDNDQAGQQATHLSLSRLEAAHLEPKVLVLSGAKDPDEYVSKFGIDSFKALLPKAKTALNWRLTWAYKQATQPDGSFDETLFFKQAVTFLALINSPLAYANALKEVRKLVSSQEESTIDREVELFKRTAEYQQLLRNQKESHLSVSAIKNVQAAANNAESASQAKQLKIKEQVVLPQELLNILWLLANDNRLYTEYKERLTVELLGKKFWPIWLELEAYLSADNLDAASLLHFLANHDSIAAASRENLSRMFMQESELNSHDAGKSSLENLLLQLQLYRTKAGLDKVSWKLRNKNYQNEAELQALREEYQRLSRQQLDLKRQRELTR